MQKNHIFLGAFLFLIGLNLICWGAIYQSRGFRAVFFDIGQGDAAFLETAQGHQILIDGGPGKTILARLGNVMPIWDRTIDLIVLTHPESDHITGLVNVLKRYKVETILWTGVKRDTRVFESWEKAIEEEGADIVIAKAGQKVLWLGGSLDILYPFESLKGETPKDSNDTSIIAKLVVGEDSILFTGDTVKKIEKSLIEKGVDVAASILKVAHHGSKTSSSEVFVKAVAPNTAVISLRKDNSYGHPHETTIATLKRYGINIRRTDEEGNITFYLK